MDNTAIVILIGSVALYFVPTIAAGESGPNHSAHHNLRAIFALNLLLGWTVIGWIVALVWALTKPRG